MYDSGITAKNFIDSVKEESDITIVIPDASWYRWLASVEQILYTEVFKEYDVVKKDITDSSAEVTVSLADLPVASGCDSITFDDVIAVFMDYLELERSGETAALQYPEKPLYYTDYSGKLYARSPIYAEQMLIVYRKRPPIKTATSTTSHVMVPVEWLDLVGAKLRGEAYKIANEDGLSAKWLNDYNTQLESLKVWAAKRNERYGR